MYSWQPNGGTCFKPCNDHALVSFLSFLIEFWGQDPPILTFPFPTEQLDGYGYSLACWSTSQLAALSISYLPVTGSMGVVPRPAAISVQSETFWAEVSWNPARATRHKMSFMMINGSEVTCFWLRVCFFRFFSWFDDLRWCCDVAMIEIALFIPIRMVCVVEFSRQHR